MRRTGIFLPRAGAAVLAALVFTLIGVAWNRETTELSANSAKSVRAAVRVGPSCPLTNAQQKKAVAAWKQMMPVFRHPRCSNCHGGVPDPFPAEGEASRRHMGVVDVEASFRNSKTSYCENCHMKGWRQPGPFVFWKDKSSDEVCGMMKDKFTAPGFVDHIERDGGGVPFIETAFIGERGLDESGQGVYEAETEKKFVAEPPPGSHALFIQQARDWVAAQGGTFAGDRECGCVYKEKGELYALSVILKNTSGWQGITVEDSVKMRVRVVDTSVTVSDVINYSPTATPFKINYPTGYVEFVEGSLGGINVTNATGSIALDFPAENQRGLKIDFTHTGTTAPAFWNVRTVKPTGRQKMGGGDYSGLPFSVQFTLVPGKKQYDNGPDPTRLVMTKLTLLSSTK